MAFKKGQSGNPAGRKRGVPNRSTNEMRNFVYDILNANFSKTKINNDFKSLNAKQRIDCFFKLLEFTLAKPKFDETVESNNGQISFVENIMEQFKKVKSENDS